MIPKTKAAKKPRGYIPTWESLDSRQLCDRLLRKFPEFAGVKLLLSRARPPHDLIGFHSNLRTWRKVIAGLNLPCFVAGHPPLPRTQRAVEWLLLDSCKPMGAKS